MAGLNPPEAFRAATVLLAAWLAASPAVARPSSGPGDDAAPSPAGVPAAGDGPAPAAVDLSAPAPAPALDASWPELSDVTFASVALGAAGFVTAFVVHEACHAVANLSMANVPTLEPVRFLGVVPFFAVSPNVTCSGGTCTKAGGQPFLPGPRGYAFIVSSGILCQEITDEIILTENPNLRREPKPFLKGMLLFNTATSVAYAIANLSAIEPPAGDLRGLDGVAGVPHGVLAGVVLATAALDVARYFLPDVAWLPWVSRGTKVVTLGLVLSF